MSNTCEVCELLDYCECPSQWELYSTELDADLDPWFDSANSAGWSWWAFRRRLELKYSHPGLDRVHAISIRESPFLARIRAENAPVEVIGHRLVSYP